MAREWCWNGTRFVTEVAPEVDETAVAYHARVMKDPSTFNPEGLDLPAALRNEGWDLWDVDPERNKDGDDDVAVYVHILGVWEILVVGGSPFLRSVEEEGEPLSSSVPRTYAEIRALYEKMKAGA